MEKKTNKDFEAEDLFSDLLEEEIKYTPAAEQEDLFLDSLDLDELTSEESIVQEAPQPEPRAEKSSPQNDNDDDGWLDDILFNYDDRKYKNTSQDSADETDDLLHFLDNENIASTYHPWRISLYEKLPFICEEGGREKIFLIGYKNGQMARKKETHFEQHETDPIPYLISLDPDPHFISYSFLYGFLRETLEKMYLKNRSDDDLRATVKKKTTEDFFAKYSFDFKNNPVLLKLMKEYVETMIENIMDSTEKRGG